MNQCCHHAPPNHFNRAFMIAILANLVFTLIETGLAFMAHSSSLLADAGHNFGDILGLGLAWGANILAQRPAKGRYSYGYQRTSILAAFFNALILMLTSALIGMHAVEKLLHPQVVNEMVIIWVAALGIVVNGSTALLFMRGRHDLNIRGAFLHLAFDALISLGVVVAGAVIYYTHWGWIDPFIGLVIVVTIVWGSWDIFSKSLGMILDAVPHHLEVSEVKAYLASLPDVAEVHDLHIWGLSTSEVALTAHLVMPDRHLADREYLAVNQELLERFGIGHVTLQVERGEMGEHNCCED